MYKPKRTNSFTFDWFISDKQDPFLHFEVNIFTRCDSIKEKGGFDSIKEKAVLFRGFFFLRVTFNKSEIEIQQGRRK